MNLEQRLICQMVGASALGAELPAMDNPNWENIHNEFAAQAIIALPAQILNQLPIPKELLNQWQRELMSTSAHAIQLISNQNELIRLLGGHRIPYAILKGVAAAKYYPLPWLRTMGDVDFIVLPKDYERTKHLMLSNGFVQTEHDNPRHEAFELNNTHYELHHHFTSEPDDNKIIDELIYEQLDNAVEASVMNYSFKVLPDPLNGIILIQHIRNHLRTGLGLRQMIDWFMYVKTQLNDEKWPAFKEIADQVGLTTLAKVTTRIGQLYFGLDTDITWCKDADESVCTDIMDFIFRSGNFGRKDQENIKVSYIMGKLRKDAFATLQEAGKHNWKALKKYPWLEPVAWFYQIFRYMKQGAGTVGKIGQNQKRSKDMDELMKKLM